LAAVPHINKINAPGKSKSCTPLTYTHSSVYFYLSAFPNVYLVRGRIPQQ